jgi:stage III sporulation protein AH
MNQQENKKPTTKRVIIAVVLIVILALVGYLNYALNNSGEKPSASPEASGSPMPSASDGTANLDPNTTDADLQAALASSQNFYKDFRSQRETNRTQEVVYLDSIINDKNTDKDTLADAQQTKIDLVGSMEMENKIEGLVKAKGFEDCLATVSKSSINVVVKTKQLTQQQAAQIMDIVKSESGEAVENIKIITRE